MNIINNVIAAGKTAANTIKTSRPVRGTKRFFHEVRVEFEAQRIVAAQKAMEREHERVAGFNSEQMAEYIQDNAEILMRAAQLRGYNKRA